MPQRQRRRLPPKSLVARPKAYAGGLLLTALLACAGHTHDIEPDFDVISLLQVTGVGCSSVSSLVCKGRCFGGICLLGDMQIDSENLLAESSAITWAPLATPPPTHQAERKMLLHDVLAARTLPTLSTPVVPRSAPVDPAIRSPPLLEQLPQQWEPLAQPEYERAPPAMQPHGEAGGDKRNLDTDATLRVLRSLELRLEDSGRAAVSPSQTRAIWPGISLGAGLASKLDVGAVDVDRGLGDIGLSATLSAAQTQQHGARSEDASDLGAISNKQIGVLVAVGIGLLSLSTCCLCYMCVDVNAKPATPEKEEEDEAFFSRGPLGQCGYCIAVLFTACGPVGHMFLLVALALTAFLVAFLLETNAMEGIEVQLVSYGFLAEAVILVVALVAVTVFDFLRKRYFATKKYFDKRFKPVCERLERTMNMANTYLSQMPGLDDAEDWLEDITGFDMFEGNTDDEAADPNMSPEEKLRAKQARDKVTERVAAAKAKSGARKKAKKTGLCF